MPTRSIRPILNNPAAPGKTAAYTQVNRGDKVGRSVRTERWRYTEWGPDGRLGIELYDHREDSGEYYNLGANPEFSSVRRQMKKVLDEGFPEAK